MKDSEDSEGVRPQLEVFLEKLNEGDDSQDRYDWFEEIEQFEFSKTTERKTNHIGRKTKEYTDKEVSMSL